MNKQILLVFGILSILMLSGCSQYNSETDECLVWHHFKDIHSPIWEGDGQPMTNTQAETIRSYGFEPITIGTECVKWKRK